MPTHRTYADHDMPRIPMRHTSWFMHLLMALAVLILAGVVYGFWGISQAPSPALDVPDAAQLPPPPANEPAR
jgi:hypothetical protein